MNENLIGVAAVITAISTPIVLIVVARINAKVKHIDHAVNGKEPGAQSMVSQVAEIHDVVIEPETT